MWSIVLMANYPDDCLLDIRGHESRPGAEQCRDESSQSSADWFNTRHFSSCSSCYHGRKNRDKTRLGSRSRDWIRQIKCENVNRRETGATGPMRIGMPSVSLIWDKGWVVRGESLATLPHLRHYNINTEPRGAELSINYSYHSDNANTSQNNNYTHNIHGKGFMLQIWRFSPVCNIIDNLSRESSFGPSNSDVDNPMKM